MRVLVRNLHVLVLAAAIMAIAPPQGGCTPIAPGQDKFVVTAERELANSVDTVYAFWKFDRDNHDYMAQKLPQVHAFAQKTREDFWVKYYDPALAAVRMYKQSRNPTDAQNQEDRLTALRDLVAQVRQALLQAQSAKTSPPSSG